MSRLATVEPDEAKGRARELLDQVQSALGVVPNMTKVMANSPALLAGYIALSGALGAGELDTGTRERIAITVAEVNGCDYCLSAHSYIGANMAKVDPDELDAARDATSADSRIHAILQLAHAIARHRGHVDDATIARARAAGLDDAQIAETIGHVALNMLTNVFNTVAQVDNDWPAVVAHNPAA